MQLPADVKVVKIDEWQRPTLQGPPEKMHRVYYTVAGQGPFTEDFKVADYTPENVAKLIATRAETTRLLIGAAS